MCGIVGLLILDRDLEPQLGELLAAMLVQMTERGPDSAGVAVYSDGLPEAAPSTRAAPTTDVDWASLAAAVGATPTTYGRAAVLTGAAGLRHELEARGVRVVSSGRDLEVFKGVGLPVDITKRLRPAGPPADISASATPAWRRSRRSRWTARTRSRPTTTSASFTTVPSRTTSRYGVTSSVRASAS